MANTTIFIQIVSISTTLLASGAIASSSLFEIPEMQAQPASRSLPSARWYFSRGSHIFPQAAALASAGFAYLAYDALPTTQRALTQLLQWGSNSSKVNGYLFAAVLTIGIAPWTALVMVRLSRSSKVPLLNFVFKTPTNFAIIKMNDELGGERSAASAKVASKNYRPGERSVDDLLDGKGEASQFMDLSGPQAKTQNNSTELEDRRARELLVRFNRLNVVRAVLLGAGGVVGLLVALNP